MMSIQQKSPPEVDPPTPPAPTPVDDKGTELSEEDKAKIAQEELRRLQEEG